MYLFELVFLDFFVHDFEHLPLKEDGLIFSVDLQHFNRRLSTIDVSFFLFRHTSYDSKVKVQVDPSKDVESLSFSSILNFKVFLQILLLLFR